MWKNLRGTFWLDNLKGKGLETDRRMTSVICVREVIWHSVWACVNGMITLRLHETSASAALAV